MSIYKGNTKVLNNIVIPLNDYSTDESTIGKWIDNKPIYRKVINWGTLPSTANTEVIKLHSIANIDKILSIKGFAIGNSTVEYNSFALPFVEPGDDTATIKIIANKSDVRIECGSDRSAYEAYAIIEYTKTTD